MRKNQISLALAMRQMRFFNERAGSTENNARFFQRMHLMYPSVTQRVFSMHYDYAMSDAEFAHREKPTHLRTNPMKH